MNYKYLDYTDPENIKKAIHNLYCCMPDPADFTIDVGSSIASGDPNAVLYLDNSSLLDTNALFVYKNSQLGVGTSNPAAMVHILASVATDKGLIVKGASAQTANLQEWQNNAGTVLSSITKDGYLGIGVLSPTAPIDLNNGVARIGVVRTSYINTHNNAFTVMRTDATAGNAAFYNKVNIGSSSLTPNSTLQVQGSFSGTPTTFSTTSTAGTSFSYIFTGTTTSQELDLPAGVSGRTYLIKNRGTQTFSIDPNGSEEIFSSSALGAGNTLDLLVGEGVIIQWDGSYWNVIASY